MFLHYKLSLNVIQTLDEFITSKSPSYMDSMPIIIVQRK